MKKTYTILNLLALTILLTACAKKITAIGTISNTSPEGIPSIFKFSKPDAGFQVVQTDKTSYMWLTTNLSFPENISGGKVYTKENINQLTSGFKKPEQGAETKYFEEGRYRVVRMVSTGTVWDYFFLHEELAKVKNAATLKFSVHTGSDETIYLFSYKK